MKWLLTAVIGMMAIQISGEPSPGARLSIRGDRAGNVVVSDASGRTIRQFTVNRSVVRETFLIAQQAAAVASTADETVFWRLSDGKLYKRLARRVYGFSPDEKRFITFSPDEGLALYAYPSFKKLGLLAIAPMPGVKAFVFSPDSRFLAASFESGYPGSDEHYPGPDPHFRSVFYVKLFDLKTRQPITELEAHRQEPLGRFEADSSAYVFTANSGQTVRLDLKGRK